MYNIKFHNCEAGKNNYFISRNTEGTLESTTKVIEKKPC